MELAVSAAECQDVRETWTLHHLTDTHIDDPDHAAELLKVRVQQIADDPKALWLGGGDYGSLILPSDPRFGGALGDEFKDALFRIPDRYLEVCEELFRPIRHKCIGLGTGNHEATIGKHYHRGVGAELASRLGIADKYLGVRGWAIVRFKLHRRVIALRTYQYHGWSAGRLKGRKAIQAERDVGAWRADALFLGHDHQPYSDVYYTEEAYDSKSGYKLRQRPVAVINGGSWTFGQRPPLKGKTARNASEFPNESWVEGRNFRPQPPVHPILLVHLDFGHGATDDQGNGRRATSFAFETRMLAPAFDIEAA